MNLIEIKEVINNFSDSTALTIITDYVDKMGRDISNIINQDVDDVTDGEVIDQIVAYLKNKDIYVGW